MYKKTQPCLCWLAGGAACLGEAQEACMPLHACLRAAAEYMSHAPWARRRTLRPHRGWFLVRREWLPRVFCGPLLLTGVAGVRQWTVALVCGMG